MHIPESPDELNTLFSTLDDSEKSTTAVKMCELIIAQDLFGDSTDAWVVRQVLKYIPKEKHSAYTSFILANQSASDTVKENVKHWLGDPFDAEGAVILMESIYNEDGWKLILSSNSPFTVRQRIRILNKLQESNAEALLASVIFQSNSTSTKTTHQEHLKSAIRKWMTPHEWPNVHALDIAQKQTLWCAYAYLNMNDILMPLAKKLGWSFWANEQELRPNTDHYHRTYKKRKEYINNIVKNNTSLNNQMEVALPELTLTLF